MLVTWTLAPYFNNKDAVHWHFCFASVLQAKFKFFCFSVKEIESDLQIQNTSHNQTLILWFVWYEFSTNRKVLLCWPKCPLIHIRWAIPAYLLNTELMKKQVRKVFPISRIKIETVSKDLLACYFTERLHKTHSKLDRNRRKNIGWVAKKSSHDTY